MSEYNAKNYTELGGEVTHIGGVLQFDEGGKMSGGLLPNQEAATGTGTTGGTNAVNAINALLLKMKNAGLMKPDDFTMQYATVTDTVAGHADRQYNTGKISNVAVDNDNHEITITLSDKVKNLKDFDGLHGWGVHKWLGIGLGVGISPITGLSYNGSAITDEDVAEASQCTLDAGYFVRWVAADLVLAGDNSEKSKDYFTLWADGYEETRYTLKIVEPA